MLDQKTRPATERLRAYLERRIGANKAQDEYGDAFIGVNDWQVTEAEAEVFMLDPDKVQQVGPVWEAYCNAIGADFEMRGEVDGGLFAELRQEHPFLEQAMHGGDTGHDMPYKSMTSFVRFGELFGIDHPTCVSWYWKVFFMMQRREVDESL